MTVATRELREGIATTSDGAYRLIASRERATGALVFPPTTRPGWDEVVLPAVGELFSHSRVEMASPHFPAGYAVGVVEFALEDSRVLVFGQLRGPAGHDYRIGERVETVETALWTESGDSGEVEVRGFAFAPEAGR